MFIKDIYIYIYILYYSTIKPLINENSSQYKYQHRTNRSLKLHLTPFLASLQVVGRDREQRSANDRADCWKAGSGTAAWSRCWSQRLVVSHDGADGCGSEEDGAGDLLHLHCDLLGFFLFSVLDFCGVIR